MWTRLHSGSRLHPGTLNGYQIASGTQKLLMLPTVPERQQVLKKCAMNERREDGGQVERGELLHCC